MVIYLKTEEHFNIQNSHLASTIMSLSANLQYPINWYIKKAFEEANIHFG